MPYHGEYNRMRTIAGSNARGRARSVVAIALAVVAATAVLAVVATAGPTAAKQRVQITQRGDGSFVLAPLTSGAVKHDSGGFAACCWSRRDVTHAGESVEIDNPRITLAGKLGTIVARNRIEFVDIPGGEAVFTGTWRVIRATGAYFGLIGGGRVAGVQDANGSAKAVFQGFLSPR
jgi:hypothetical protein